MTFSGGSPAVWAATDWNSSGIWLGAHSSSVPSELKRAMEEVGSNWPWTR